MAGALVALALAAPSYAQGRGGGPKPGKGPPRPPSTSGVSAPPSSTTPPAGGETVDIGAPGPSGGSLTTAMPFAWLDDASVIEPGSAWLGVSMVRWQGAGIGQTIGPVIDAAIGMTPRVQLAASVPRVAGGLGTMFFGAKIAVVTSDARAFQVAVAPTLEILDGASMPAGPAGQGPARWGLPISAQIDRAGSRIYASSGYFSPGIWFAGAGVGRAVGDRAGVSMSFSHAWATSPETSLDATRLSDPRRSEITGGASYDVRPHLAVFGSIGRTIGIAADDGAGTTVGFGMAVSVAPGVVTQ